MARRAFLRPPGTKKKHKSTTAGQPPIDEATLREGLEQMVALGLARQLPSEPGDTEPRYELDWEKAEAYRASPEYQAYLARRRGPG